MIRGERIRTLREAKGLTQKDLAEQLDIGEKEIWRYENTESNPTSLKLTKIALFFNVSTDYILGLSDKPSPYNGGDLTLHELEALAAWRKGDIRSAIKAIVNEEESV